MTAKSAKGFPELEERLGHSFSEPKLLRRALTHPSHVSKTDYERLEFLGDRVLGLTVAELLYERFPKADEGEMARRFNRLVRKETCADVARELGLGDYVILGSGEVQSGGRRKLAILGDVCESVIAAVFLDGGFQPARDMIRRLWTPRLSLKGDIRADAKTTLQEWLQGRGFPLPRYIIAERDGPAHAPHFRVEVEIAGMESGFGDGASKRAAEQEAARTVLLRERIWRETNNE